MTHNKKIKRLTLLILSFIAFVSCHSQEKESIMEKKETKIIENYFAKQRFKNTEENFNKVNQNLLGILPNQLQNGYNNLMIFNESTDYQISKEGKFIKIGNDILPDLDSINLENNQKHPYFEELVTLNKIIYQDDLTSLLNVATRNSDLAIDLVVLFNYEKNEALFHTAVQNIQNWEDFEKSNRLAFIFYNDPNKSTIIREKLLKALVTHENFFYAMTFYLADNKEKIIKSNGINNLRIEKAIAYLLNIGFQDKMEVDVQTDKSYMLLNNIYVAHSNLLDIFEKNEYFGYKELNKYSQDYKLFLSDNQEKNYARIQDPDGYTNLRKEKNTTSEILQKIKTGEKIEVLDNSGDWFLIQTQDGKKGYVHKSRIK